MVKRFPHTAIITYQSTGGHLTNGEWVNGEESTVEIKGRFDRMERTNVLRINPKGSEVIVRGEFYTKQKAMPGAVSLEIAELGVKRDIICWWDFQTHSMISV